MGPQCGRVQGPPRASSQGSPHFLIKPLLAQTPWNSQPVLGWVSCLRLPCQPCSTASPEASCSSSNLSLITCPQGQRAEVLSYPGQVLVHSRDRLWPCRMWVQMRSPAAIIVRELSHLGEAEQASEPTSRQCAHCEPWCLPTVFCWAEEGGRLAGP